MTRFLRREHPLSMLRRARGRLFRPASGRRRGTRERRGRTRAFGGIVNPCGKIRIVEHRNGSEPHDRAVAGGMRTRGTGDRIVGLLVASQSRGHPYCRCRSNGLRRAGVADGDLLITNRGPCLKSTKKTQALPDVLAACNRNVWLCLGLLGHSSRTKGGQSITLGLPY